MKKVPPLPLLKLFNYSPSLSGGVGNSLGRCATIGRGSSFRDLIVESIVFKYFRLGSRRGNILKVLCHGRKLFERGAGKIFFSKEFSPLNLTGSA